MPPTNLPSLRSEDRPAYAKRAWQALIESATSADTPPMIWTLRDALISHQLYTEPAIDDRLGDSGHLVAVSMSTLVSSIWPSLGWESGDYDLENELSRHSYQFRQRLSQYLRGTVNAVCVKRGGRTTQSRWWVRTEWHDGSPRRFAVMRVDDAEAPPGPPETPDIELMRLRDENALLRQQLDASRHKAERLEAMLQAITD